MYLILSQQEFFGMFSGDKENCFWGNMQIAPTCD